MAARCLATGTVNRVDGDTVYTKSTSGNTVQVRLLPTTQASAASAPRLTRTPPRRPDVGTP